VHVEDTVRPRDYLDDADDVLPLLEDARHQTGSVGPRPSGDAVLDANVMALDHRFKSTTRRPPSVAAPVEAHPAGDPAAPIPRTPGRPTPPADTQREVGAILQEAVPRSSRRVDGAHFSNAWSQATAATHLNSATWLVETRNPFSWKKDIAP
jgi:hypothetical protein